MDPFFGDRHGDTVWAGSLDDAVERAWTQARHEDWQVRVVIGWDGEVEFPEPEEPLVAPYAYPQTEDALW